jgi:hypothetical protein
VIPAATGRRGPFEATLADGREGGGQGCKRLATERRNLALQVNAERCSEAWRALTKSFTGREFRAFGAKGIVLTNDPQAPATNVPNESLTACTRFANQINHFSSEIIHH